MIQFFIFGSSFVYGVGGENGGFADILKQQLHGRLYGPDGLGEQCELFAFGKPGESLEFIRGMVEKELGLFGRDGSRTVVIVWAGDNNSKAIEEPDNIVSTPEEYRESMTTLLGTMKGNSDRVISVGGGYVDESKTNPKRNPFTGGRSYFTNANRGRYGQIRKEVCEELAIEYVELDVPEAEWIGSCLSADGLHPNDKGHRLIANRIWNVIEKELVT